MIRKEDSLLGPYRVLDLSNEQGYFCGKILGDLGADVIKIEPPGGDPGRNIGPFYKDIVDPEKSLNWFALNTSKRGITLNIETRDGQEIFERLVHTADFVIESFPPGYLDNLGLGYRDLEEVNPRIIMTSITPFGQTGPRAHYQASDMVVWAMTGYMFVTGDTDRAPVRISIPQACFHGGLHAAVGSLVAHYYRESARGEGQHVDVSMQEACMQATMRGPQSWEHLKAINSRGGVYDKIPRPKSAGAFMKRNLWPCKDGFVNMILTGGGQTAMVRSSSALVKWANAEGKALELKDYDWSTFDTSTTTQEERARIDDAIISFLMTKTKRELNEAALQKSMALMSVNNMDGLLGNSQLAAREFWVEVEHPNLGHSITYPGAPFKLSEAPWRIWRCAPLIGEHNEEIYKGELGLSNEELAILKRANAI